MRDQLEKSRGVNVSDAALDVLLDFAAKRIVNRRFPDKAIDLLEQAVAVALVAGRTQVRTTDAVAATEQWEQRASSTPTLERFGRELTALARQGALGPIVGRDREIDAVTEILLRRTRRNPLLLGPAGAGKTAIVEGLAIRLAGSSGVPEPLRDVRVFDVALLPLAAAVTADASVLTDFLVEARHPSVVVFFDEIHQLAAQGVHDLAQALKPALARGEIACIGATTFEEYQASLESDAALVRRFTQVPVTPMDASTVMGVLRAVRDSLTRARHVTMDDAALDEVAALADQFLPNRSFPDKGVDVIEQSIAHAVARGETTVTKTTVREAMEQVVGVPLDPTSRLQALSAALANSGLLSADARSSLLARLGVSLRGLDSRGDSPDAVILMCDAAAPGASALERIIATTIYGRDAALIALDVGSMADEQSLSTLIGSAPGLIGSDRPLPLADLRRDPRQVVAFHGIDRAAGVVRDTIASGLPRAGSRTPWAGHCRCRRRSSCSARLALTAELAPVALGPVLIGRVRRGRGHAGRTGAGAAGDGWVRARLLDPLVARLRRQGVEVTLATISWAGWSRMRRRTWPAPRRSWIATWRRGWWRRCRHRHRRCARCCAMGSLRWSPCRPADPARAGGDEGTRTPDPRDANAVLSQLSYIPTGGRVYVTGSAQAIDLNRTFVLSCRRAQSLTAGHGGPCDPSGSLGWRSSADDGGRGGPGGRRRACSSAAARTGALRPGRRRAHRPHRLRGSRCDPRPGRSASYGQCRDARRCVQRQDHAGAAPRRGGPGRRVDRRVPGPRPCVRPC